MNRAGGRRRLSAAAKFGKVALGVAAALVAVLAAAPRAAGAHELGPFQVYGSFQLNGAFRLEIKIDEEHLAPAQLGGPARTTRYGRIAGLSGPAEKQFGRYLSDLADSLTIAFDGAEVTPALAMDPEAGGGPGGGPGSGLPTRATLLVEGWTPGGARAFTLRSSLPVKSFPLVLRCEGDESSVWKWVTGGETSPAYALPPRVVPPARAAVARRCFELGFAAILPYGPTALLVVAAIFLLARRVAAALAQLAVFAGGQALGLILALRAAAPPRPEVLEPLLALAVAGLAAACLAMPMARPRPRPAPGTGPPSPPGSSPEPPTSPPAAAPAALRFGRLRAAWPTPAWLLAAVLAVGALYGASLAPVFAAHSVNAANSPSGAVPPPAPPAAMAGFDLGVFSAGLVALAAAFALVGLPFRDKSWYQGRVVVPASCLIGLVGLYWSLAGLLSS